MLGLYALESNLEVAAFAQGVRAARLPYRYRNHNAFTPDQTEPFETVVLSGLREKGGWIRDAYASRGVPVVVIDYGYLRRTSGVATWDTGHWQVGLNRLGWVPPFQCPADRFDSLGIEIVTRRKRGGAVLVCGQHAGDPSHGLDEGGIAKWAEREIRAIKAIYRKGPVLWRPHPDSARIEVPGHDGQHVGPVVWDELHAVVCINSNIGHEALLKGVPVFCRPDAPYEALGNKDYRDFGTPVVPSVERRRDYFQRLAYAQWTLEEMRQGKAVDFILSTARRLHPCPSPSF